MKTYPPLLLALIFSCCFFAATAQTCVPCNCIESEPRYATDGEFVSGEDFQRLTTGQPLTQSSQWRLFEPGTPNAAGRVEQEGPNRFARFRRTATEVPDVLFPLGPDPYNPTWQSGRYRISMRMRVAPGKSGYYDIISRQTGTQTADVAYRVLFFPTGQGEIRVAGTAFRSEFTLERFSYTPGVWTTIVNIIDLDKNQTELWINDNIIKFWKHNEWSVFVEKQIAAIGFYGRQADMDCAVDNLCVWRKKGGCPPGGETSCVKNNTTYPAGGPSAKCDLYSQAEMDTNQCTSVCDLAGTDIHRNDTRTGRLDLGETAPSLLVRDPLVATAYGGTVPTNLHSDTYIFYRDPAFDNKSVGVNFTGSNSRVTYFIYTCGNGTPGCPAGQILLQYRPTNGQVVNTGAQPCDGFFYIVVTGLRGDSYRLSISPEDRCPDVTSVLSNTMLTNQQVSSTSLTTFQTGPGNAYAGCYAGNLQFRGGEKFYKIEIPVPLDGREENGFARNFTYTYSVKPDGNNERMGVFLYSYLCGRNCLAYGESPSNGAEAVVNMVNPPPGTYFLVVDKNTTGGNRGFTITPSIVGSIFKVVCLEDPNTHKVTLKPNNPNIVPGDFIELRYRDSRRYLQSIKQELSNVIWNGDNTNGIRLEVAGFDTYDPSNCSYTTGDTLHMVVSRNTSSGGSVARYEAIFDPANGATITAAEQFEPNAQSSIRNLLTIEGPTAFSLSSSELKFNQTNNSVQKVRIHTPLYWKIINPVPWVTYTNRSGSKVIEFNVLPNPEAARSAIISFESTDSEVVRVANLKISQNGVLPLTDSGLERGAILETAVNIFPNPTTGMVYLSYPVPENGDVVQINVVDALGRVVVSTDLEQVEAAGQRIDLSAEPSGIYVLHFRTNAGTVTKSIVLRH